MKRLTLNFDVTVTVNQYKCGCAVRDKYVVCLCPSHKLSDFKVVPKYKGL